MKETTNGPEGQTNAQLELLNTDKDFLDLWLLRSTLEQLLNEWGDCPVRQLNALEREAVGDFDYIIGAFAMVKTSRVRERIKGSQPAK